MKNTIRLFVLFVLIFNTFSKRATALSIPNINFPTIAPVATLTPTPIPTLIKIKIDPNLIKIMTTATPTPILTPTPVVVTQVVTQMVTPKETEVSPTATEDLSVEPSVVATKSEEKTEGKIDLKLWFMNITLGLLVVIILIQIWPKKKIS